MSRKISSTETKPDWQPDAKIVNEIKDIIIRAYTESKGVYDLTNTFTIPEKPSKFLDQYAKIGAFLRDTEAVTKQLIKLNTLLTEAVSKDSDSSKILREVLEKEVAKFGFQPQFGKVNELISSGKFRETIRKGLLLKDPGTRSLPHGDFTHAIQWLMIAWQHRDTNFLAEDDKEPTKVVIEIFKSLGKDAAVFESAKQVIVGFSDHERTIWDLLVDIDPDYNTKRPTDTQAWKKDPKGFRSPENLNIFLFSNEMPQLAFLKILVLARELKRAQEHKNASENKTVGLNSKIKTQRTGYSLFSPLPLQLPYKLLKTSEDLADLKLNTDDEEDEEPLHIEQESKEKSDSLAGESAQIDDAYFDSCEEKINKRQDEEVIKFLSGKVQSPQPTEKTLQKIHYYLGIAYSRTNIKLADLNMRKAYNLTRSARQTPGPEKSIPLKSIIENLANYQYVLRVTAESVKETYKP